VAIEIYIKHPLELGTGIIGPLGAGALIHSAKRAQTATAGSTIPGAERGTACACITRLDRTSKAEHRGAGCFYAYINSYNPALASALSLNNEKLFYLYRTCVCKMVIAY
jgi:hypothetical protein